MITHTQRLKAVKEGRILDRPAYTAWGPHMSLVDRNVKDFTEATIAYQNSYQFDFIKLMSNGMYFTEDFGQKIKPAAHIMDDTWLNVTVNAVNDPHEWARLKAPDVKKVLLAERSRHVNGYVTIFRERCRFCLLYSAHLYGWGK